MTKIIGVRFKPTGKVYFFDPQGLEISRGEHVIVETSRGVEYGEVMQGVKEVEDTVVTKPLKGVLRLATAEDTQRYEENKQKEKEAHKICVEKIRNHGLEMKLIEVEYTFDGSKILFYFTADGRVDFRELVKDLASVFKTRIELRQIGVRDESKTLGSIGVCGRDLCCSRFLEEFVPVSIKMAKEQGLSLNPSKISGACGRLMCCLKYEQETYEYLNSETPSTGSTVMTPDGAGTVVSVSILRGKACVRLENDGAVAHKDFAVSDIKPIRRGATQKADAEDTKDMENDTERYPKRKTAWNGDGDTESRRPNRNGRRNRRPVQKNSPKQSAE